MSTTPIIQTRLVNDGPEFDGELRIKIGRRQLLPGTIDHTVHFRAPGKEFKADMASDSAVSVAGGLASFMDLPNTHPPKLHRKSMQIKYRRAEGRCHAKHGFYRSPSTTAFLLWSLLAVILPMAAPAQQRQDIALPPPTLRDTADMLGIVFPTSVSQGAMMIGKVPAGSIVRYADRSLRVTSYGSVVFGVGRDEQGPLQVSVQPPKAPAKIISITVTGRDWPIENIKGVPPATVNPPKAIAERIAREQARVVAVRSRDDERSGFAQAFIWPVKGRISGRFGNQRVYNGTPKSAHSGMDIAVPTGTPVKAPADGVITFADPGLYLTGGTLVLDHGHGISSNFLHLSRIDVEVGDSVQQGQVIAAVGATGRATGPHLHWGMNWFDTRIDPLLVLERK